MWKTVSVLLATLVSLPILAYFYDTKPDAFQQFLILKVVYLYIFLSATCFIVSTLTKNYSQVDKLWSIAPIFYAWIVAFYTNWEPRVVLMAILITIWGSRLTFNFARRGGYSWKFWTGDEDYRWAVLRAKPEFQAPWKWMLFNLSFISFYQMGIVMLIMFPMIKASGANSINWIDYLLAGIILALVIIEFIADQQQYDFQTEKYKRIKNNENLGQYAHGFTNVGLWKYSRHPNYACEQLIWIVLYFYSVNATGSWVNWSLPGAVLLAILFYGSSKFSEEITASKYPTYAAYQKTVSRFIPKIY